jgi:hypothetical protein
VIVFALSRVNLRIFVPNCFLVMDIFPPPLESHSRWLGSAYFRRILFAFAVFLLPLAVDIDYALSNDDRVVHRDWISWHIAILAELFYDKVGSNLKYLAFAP